MSFLQANMQTGILVLLVVLAAILCVTLFFTNKEVRNIKTGFVKNRHDISALQTLLSDVGLSATNRNPEEYDEFDNGLQDEQGYPSSSFGGNPMMGMVPPEHFPDNNQFNPEQPDQNGPLSPLSPIQEEFRSPDPSPANTVENSSLTGAVLNLEKPVEVGSNPEVIPSEDVEQVKKTLS